MVKICCSSLPILFGQRKTAHKFDLPETTLRRKLSSVYVLMHFRFERVISL